MHEFTAVQFISILLTLTTFPVWVKGHGYMVEPPTRQSAWRFGYSSIPPNYDDNAVYCGGLRRQWDVNGGRCGVCGDAWDSNPRSYEHPDGAYVKGVPPVNKEYAMGQTVEVVIRQTAGHRGYHEFRLCNRDNLAAPDATHECLQGNVLHLENGATRSKEDAFCNGIYKFRVKLPDGVTCENASCSGNTTLDSTLDVTKTAHVVSVVARGRKSITHARTSSSDPG